MSAEPADFADKDGAALVIGASGGLGRSIAALMAARGSALALTWRSAPESVAPVIELAHAHGVRVRDWELDVEDPAQAESVIEEVADHFGGIHTLIYAAGPHVPMTHLSKVAPGHLLDQVTVDVIGCANVVLPALPHLRGSAGSIVAVTTAATARYPVRDSMSAIPKGAVEQLIKAVAAEEGRFGVRANCVGPGMLTDGMAQRLISSGELDERALDITRANIPLRRFGLAHDIAEAVCFLASDRAGFISGQKLDVDGGYSV